MRGKFLSKISMMVLAVCVIAAFASGCSDKKKDVFVPEVKEPLAVVESLSGDVTVVRADGAVETAAAGTALFLMDRLITVGDSWAAIGAGGCSVILVERTMLKIAESNIQDELRIESGGIWVISDTTANGGLIITTPAAFLTASNAVFIVHADDDTQVCVVDGTVELTTRNPETGGETVELYSGEKVFLPPDESDMRRGGISAYDVAALRADGGSGPGGLYPIIRGKLPGYVWTDAVDKYGVSAAFLAEPVENWPDKMRYIEDQTMATAALIVRVGDIDAVNDIAAIRGGYDPFAQKNGYVRGYSFTADGTDPAGTDEIINDRLTVAMEYDAIDFTINNAMLQLCVYDFNTANNNVYTAALNGCDAPFAAELLNAANLAGGTPLMISFVIPPGFYPELETGRLEITIAVVDETNSDGGLVIDFARLIINYDEKLIKGAVTGKTEPGATIRLLGTDMAVEADGDGAFELAAIPGLNGLSVSKDGFAENYVCGIVPADGESWSPDIILEIDDSGPDPDDIVQSGASAAFLELLASGEYALEMRIYYGEQTAELTQAALARRYAIIGNGERIVFDDGIAYQIDDASGMYVETPYDNISFYIFDFAALGCEFTENGTGDFMGFEMPFDEFITVDGDILRIFGNEEAAGFTVTDATGTVTLVEFISVADAADSGFFDIPEDYILYDRQNI